MKNILLSLLFFVVIQSLSPCQSLTCEELNIKVEDYIKYMNWHGDGKRSVARELERQYDRQDQKKFEGLLQVRNSLRSAFINELYAEAIEYFTIYLHPSMQNERTSGSDINFRDVDVTDRENIGAINRWYSSCFHFLPLKSMTTINTAANLVAIFYIRIVLSCDRGNLLVEPVLSTEILQFNQDGKINRVITFDHSLIAWQCNDSRTSKERISDFFLFKNSNLFAQHMQLPVEQCTIQNILSKKECDAIALIVKKGIFSVGSLLFGWPEKTDLNSLYINPQSSFDHFRSCVKTEMADEL